MINSSFKKLGMVVVFFVLAFTVFSIGEFLLNPTMFASLSPPEEYDGHETIGPSQEIQECMQSCVEEEGCIGGVECMDGPESDICLKKCDPEKANEIPDKGILCMEECVERNCDKFDFDCQTGYQESCEEECDMIKEPEAKNEAEQCIRDCVDKLAPGTTCSGGKEGETGNSICQTCAEECVYLYNGPCLNDEQLTAKEKACETCEHCYGKPMMGDSGEGYECIVDVECKDASSKFGDNPGTGPGIPLEEQHKEQQGSPNIIDSVSEVVSGVAQAIGDFFSEILGG